MSKPRTKKKIQDMSHEDIPVTVGLVHAVRDELKAEIRSRDHRFDSLDHKVDSLDHKFDSLDHKFESLDHKFESLDHKFNFLDHKFDSLDKKVDSLQSTIFSVEARLESKIDKIAVSVHQNQVLMEEQRGENKIVLDGIKTLIQRHDRIETEVGELRITVQTLATASR